MPVYNSEQYISKAIESILLQTYENLELIIICEYRTNQETLDILQKYTYNDKRIKIIFNKTRLNISRSLNIGIDTAAGEFIARMDADDIAYRNRFEMQLYYLQHEKKIDIVGSNTRFIDEFGIINGYADDFPLYHEKIATDLLFDVKIKHPTIMIRKSQLQRYNLRYNEKFNTSEDFELWNRACHTLKFANMWEFLLDYRWYEKNATNSNKDENYTNFLKIMNNAFLKLDLKFTDDELITLCPLRAYEYKKNRKSKFAALAKKIQKANDRYRLYDIGSLQKTLQEQMHQL
ncbi:MAG: glycosyltransferase [Desulfovibrio sp.]|jgi:glycosyltransferase involved in cell wall biosynthesis|nr:glycosyltransferase [Desulfovibrio sp.]